MPYAFTQRDEALRAKAKTRLKKTVPLGAQAELLTKKSTGPIFFELIEDFGAGQGWAERSYLDPNKAKPGVYFQLYDWGGMLTGAKTGYKGTCQYIDGEWVFCQGPCIDPACESDGQIITNDPPDGTVDTGYGHTLDLISIDPGSIAVTGLPAGLSAAESGSQVNITGTPTTAGTYMVTVTGLSDKTGPEPVESGSKCTVTKVFQLTIAEA